MLLDARMIQPLIAVLETEPPERHAMHVEWLLANRHRFGIRLGWLVAKALRVQIERSPAADRRRAYFDALAGRDQVAASTLRCELKALGEFEALEQFELAARQLAPVVRRLYARSPDVLLVAGTDALH